MMLKNYKEKIEMRLIKGIEIYFKYREEIEIKPTKSKWNPLRTIDQGTKLS